MRHLMQAISGKFHVEPPEAIWRRVIEDRKMDWHSNVQAKGEKMLTTSATQKKTKTIGRDDLV